MKLFLFLIEKKMKFYLELYENTPVMLHTTPKINHMIEIESDIKTGLSQAWVVEYFLNPLKRSFKLFIEFVDAFDFAITTDTEYIHQCPIDVFGDPETLNVQNAFPMPLKYIGNLELEYRCYNKNMSKLDCFQEAIKMWEIFSTEDYKLLQQIIHKYPIYKKQYQHHIDQYEFIMEHKGQFKSRDQLLDAILCTGLT